MSDLIERQDAVDHWRRIIDATNTDSRYNMGFVDGLEFCISHLTTMPSAQPEIVRCNECKYHDDEEPGAVYCPDRVGGWVSEDFFCAGGERRE